MTAGIKIHTISIEFDEATQRERPWCYDCKSFMTDNEDQRLRLTERHRQNVDSTRKVFEDARFKVLKVRPR